MAHEIATPLGFIKGYTTTLMRADTNWDPKTQNEFLQIIDQETDHIEGLVHNILDSARLQSGRITMAFQPVRLDTIMNDVMARFKVRFPDLVVSIEVAQPVKPIQADPLRISQVFDNIIGNAVKYAPHSPVWVRINQEEKFAHVEIIDKGPGIPPQYLPYIFEKFYRNPELSPSTHGSGLGLFICKQIINAHYGQLYAESELGQGTRFHIILPYA
jgi:signal transduction histidine kinase